MDSRRVVLCGWFLLAALSNGSVARHGTGGKELGHPNSAPLETVDMEGPVRRLTVEGHVATVEGAPQQGARLECSAGEIAIANEHGWYRIECHVPLDACTVELTASNGPGKGMATAKVEFAAASSELRVQAPLLILSQDALTTCSAAWVRSFEGAPGVGATNGNLTGVVDLALFDDGAGIALYAAGTFTRAGGAEAHGVARWNGERWLPLADGLKGNSNWAAHALEVFDDGHGPALYVGGRFRQAGGVPANGIARWDGHRWTSLGSGVNGVVHALAVFDDGSGPALAVGGGFSTAGGMPAGNVAQWNGSTWSALERGTNGLVQALTAYDDDSGPALYVGGSFTKVGDRPASRVARWDGHSWSALGAGVTGFLNSGSVNAFTAFDDGNGMALYAAGYFILAGGRPASSIAKWTHGHWMPVGALPMGEVWDLAAFDDGTGQALYAGGAPYSSSGVVGGLWKWNGSTWSRPDSYLGQGAPLGFVNSLVVLNSRGGPRLFAGGSFEYAGGKAANGVASWDGSTWDSLGAGLNKPVYAAQVFDDGTGPALYAAGNFRRVGRAGVSHLAKWSASAWQPVGPGPEGPVHALTVYDDGSGSALFAGGSFWKAGDAQSRMVAKWNGSAWAALGGGLNSSVLAMTSFDDGTGPALYAGGTFTLAGAVPAKRVARWNGSSWSPLGTGLEGPSDASVRALASFDDGSGPALYAGGDFSTAGSLPVSLVAKWDGTGWSALGSGLSGGVFQAVNALEVYDDGNGPALFVAGRFSTAGGVSVEHIAKWNGFAWSPLGGGLTGYASYTVVGSLAVFDSGFGREPHVGGTFLGAGGLAVRNLARWNGTNWSSLGSGPPSHVMSLSAFDDGGGQALFVGGDFPTSPGGDRFLAKWGCP